MEIFDLTKSHMALAKLCGGNVQIIQIIDISLLQTTEHIVNVLVLSVIKLFYANQIVSKSYILIYVSNGILSVMEHSLLIKFFLLSQVRFGGSVMRIQIIVGNVLSTIVYAIIGVMFFYLY